MAAGPSSEHACDRARTEQVATAEMRDALGEAMILQILQVMQILQTMQVLQVVGLWVGICSSAVSPPGDTGSVGSIRYCLNKGPPSLQLTSQSSQSSLKQTGEAAKAG